MKITAVETLRPAGHPNLLWLRLHTASGLIGLGETWFGAGAVEADLHERVAPLLLGEDAGDIGRLMARIRPYVGFAGTGAEMRACSAVDVALWDLAGQAAGKPIAELLGGPPGAFPGEAGTGSPSGNATNQDSAFPGEVGTGSPSGNATNQDSAFPGEVGTGSPSGNATNQDPGALPRNGKRSRRDAVPVYNTCAGPSYVSQTAEVRPDNFGLPGVAPAGAGAGGRVYEDLEAFLARPAELAAELLEMGIAAMKIWPFDFAAGAADGRDISAADLARALRPFEAVRAAHGARMRLKAELHGLWSLPAARAIAAALEPLAIDWIEDPVAMDRFDELAALAAATPTRIAGGETVGGLAGFRDLIGRGRVGVPIVDVTWGGGISVAREVAQLAAAAGRPVAFHDCSGPVTLAASVHLALACPNVEEQEITRSFYYGWYHELVDRPPPLERGRITVPEGPGLGLAPLPEALARAAVRRSEIS